jgi:ribonuclease Z
LEFTILGTGSATLQLTRFPSAFVLSVDNECILIDCGEGTQHQILKYKIKHTRIRTILISHLHGDHYFGLIGLISSWSLNKRTEPLTLIGPPGLLEIISIQLKYSGTILSFKVDFIETKSTVSEVIYENDLFFVTTIPLIHRVPCNGYLVTRKGSERKIIKERIPEDFPLPYFKKLKDGEDIFDELSGKLFKNSELTTEGDPEVKVAYCSDTAYFEEVIPIIEGADLLYHEATFTNELIERAKSTFHSTAGEAALIAKKAQVKQLVIGHYSSRYKELDGHLSEAKDIFEATLLAEEGLTVKV